MAVAVHQANLASRKDDWVRPRARDTPGLVHRAESLQASITVGPAGVGLSLQLHMPVAEVAATEGLDVVAREFDPTKVLDFIEKLAGVRLPTGAVEQNPLNTLLHPGEEFFSWHQPRPVRVPAVELSKRSGFGV